MSTSPSDLELMMLADGELEPARAREVAAAIERDPIARAKLAALGQLGDSVRTHLELATDEAEPRLPPLGDMWDDVARRIREAGAAPLRAARVSAAPTRPRATDDLAGWAAATAWLGRHRGHLVTGLVSAGAALALFLAVGPRERIVLAPPSAPSGPSAATTTPVSVATGAPCAAPAPVGPAAPPEVEDFEVYEGTGTVFTLPGEGDGDSAATVIWIDKDHVEDPI